MSYCMDESTLEVDGLTFKVQIRQDADSGKPWEECDGNGPVREFSRGYYERYSAKKPGERILHEGDRNCWSWIYDWAGAIKLAQKDGWGVSPDNRPPNWEELTPRQQREVAVQRDFDFLKAWCDEEWVWSGVVVTLMVEDDEGDLIEYDGPLNLRDSLWSVEYWQYEPLTSKKNSYISGIALEIAESAARTYRTEEVEKRYWCERDSCTV